MNMLAIYPKLTTRERLFIRNVLNCHLYQGKREPTLGEILLMKRSTVLFALNDFIAECLVPKGKEPATFNDLGNWAWDDNSAWHLVLLVRE